MSLGDFISKLSVKSNNLEGGERAMANSVHIDGQQVNSHRRDDQQKQINALSPGADDELSTRLFASVVSIVEDRRQLTMSLEEYRRYLHDAERTVEELKLDKRASQLVIEKKEEEIEASHRLVAEKQLKYDQLLDDYKQLRTNDAKEFERLQLQIKEIRLNYENLNSDYSRYRSESMREAEKMEADVRESIVKYHQLLDEYNKLREENTNLMSNIVNFTQQMSSLRVPEPKTELRKPVPIHPIVNNSENAAGS